jgi:PhnB protein
MQAPSRSDESGRIRHAEVRIGECVIMRADPVLPEWPAMPADVHVHVRDVDATHRRAIEVVAVSVQVPARSEGSSDKRGGVMDTGGTSWIATRMDE